MSGRCIKLKWGDRFESLRDFEAEGDKLFQKLPEFIDSAGIDALLEFVLWQSEIVSSYVGVHPEDTQYKVIIQTAELAGVTHAFYRILLNKYLSEWKEAKLQRFVDNIEDVGVLEEFVERVELSLLSPEFGSDVGVSHEYCERTYCGFREMYLRERLPLFLETLYKDGGGVDDLKNGDVWLDELDELEGDLGDE